MNHYHTFRRYNYPVWDTDQIFSDFVISPMMVIAGTVLGIGFAVLFYFFIDLVHFQTHEGPAQVISRTFVPEHIGPVSEHCGKGCVRTVQKLIPDAYKMKLVVDHQIVTASVTLEQFISLPQNVQVTYDITNVSNKVMVKMVH